MFLFLTNDPFYHCGSIISWNDDCVFWDQQPCRIVLNNKVLKTQELEITTLLFTNISNVKSTLRCITLKLPHTANNFNYLSSVNCVKDGTHSKGQGDIFSKSIIFYDGLFPVFYMAPLTPTNSYTIYINQIVISRKIKLVEKATPWKGVHLTSRHLKI